MFHNQHQHIIFVAEIGPCPSLFHNDGIFGWTSRLATVLVCHIQVICNCLRLLPTRLFIICCSFHCRKDHVNFPPILYGELQKLVEGVLKRCNDLPLPPSFNRWPMVSRMFLLFCFAWRAMVSHVCGTWRLPSFSINGGIQEVSSIEKAAILANVWRSLSPSHLSRRLSLHLFLGLNCLLLLLHFCVFKSFHKINWLFSPKIDV